jgi:hypothetical protein
MICDIARCYIASGDRRREIRGRAKIVRLEDRQPVAPMV